MGDGVLAETGVALDDAGRFRLRKHGEDARPAAFLAGLDQEPDFRPLHPKISVSSKHQRSRNQA